MRNVDLVLKIQCSLIVLTPVFCRLLSIGKNRIYVVVEHEELSDRIAWLRCTANDRIEILEDAKQSKRYMERLQARGTLRPDRNSCRCGHLVAILFDIFHANSTSADSIAIPIHYG